MQHSVKGSNEEPKDKESHIKDFLHIQIETRKNVSAASDVSVIKVVWTELCHYTPGKDTARRDSSEIRFFPRRYHLSH